MGLFRYLLHSKRRTKAVVSSLNDQFSAKERLWWSNQIKIVFMDQNSVRVLHLGSMSLPRPIFSHIDITLDHVSQTYYYEGALLYSVTDNNRDA